MRRSQPRITDVNISFLPLLLLLLSLFSFSALFSQEASAVRLDNPIMFVTQLPIPTEWMTISQTFGNHLGNPVNAGRGGDLWIRYPNGTLKNLTETAGYGVSGFQNSQSIAVREPSVHWSGSKALFSMVIGAPEQQYQHDSYYWQIYEISGLGENDSPVITRVPNQPAQFNNISPCYGSDERIIFVSDRPRNGQRHLYPQLDEYESAPTVTGIWSLDPLSGDLFNLNHSPSGSFRPFVDSFGRVIYTRWDHLQRDQQNEGGGNGAFNWDSEAPNSIPTAFNNEWFPESRNGNGNLNGHRFELFFPWQLNEDGTEEEVLNHIGRHELSSYFNASFNDDPNLVEFLGSGYNPNRITHMFQIKEDPLNPGYFYGIDSPTFYHHSAGRIFRIDGAPHVNPDSMMINYVTASGFSGGHFRHPLPLHNGALLAAYTSYDGVVTNLGDRAFPRSPFRFRLTTLREDNNGYWIADQPLTGGIRKAVNFWDPDVMVTYADSIDMWELDPVEVVARTRPTGQSTEIEAPEMQIFSQENIDIEQLRAFMRSNNLALVISRNVTVRDQADRQQPFNLRVSGSNTETRGAPGRMYDISHFQFFQGDQIRGYQNYPAQGRRVLATPMHDDGGVNIDNPQGPEGSVAIGDDGSVAAFVPARRALSWQSTDAAGNGVVRERYWITFQPGEIRLCAGCHGTNTFDQAGNTTPQNPPEALRDLMQHYQNTVDIESNPFAGVISRHRLIGNYPNPFNPSTTIRYQLAATEKVRLTVYNTLGQEVKILVDRQQSSGEYSVRFTAENISSGIYLYRLEAGAFSAVKKFVLMK